MNFKIKPSYGTGVNTFLIFVQKIMSLISTLDSNPSQSGDGTGPCQSPSGDLDGPIDFYHTTQKCHRHTYYSPSQKQLTWD